MGKSTSLTDVSITLSTTVISSPLQTISALKEVISKVFEMERQGVPNGLYTPIACGGLDPYNFSNWTIIVDDLSTPKYTISFQNEFRTKETDSTKRHSLSEKNRLIEVALGGNNVPTTEGEFLSLIEQIQKMEDVIAVEGESAIPVRSYSVFVKDKSPFSLSKKGTIQVSGGGLYPVCRLNEPGGE